MVEGPALVPRHLGVLSASRVQLLLLLRLRLRPRPLLLRVLPLPVLDVLQANVRPRMLADSSPTETPSDRVAVTAVQAYSGTCLFTANGCGVLGPSV